MHHFDQPPFHLPFHLPLHLLARLVHHFDQPPGSLAEKLPPNLQEALYFQAAACSIYAQYVES